MRGALNTPGRPSAGRTDAGRSAPVASPRLTSSRPRSSPPGRIAYAQIVVLRGLPFTATSQTGLPSASAVMSAVAWPRAQLPAAGAAMPKICTRSLVPSLEANLDRGGIDDCADGSALRQRPSGRATGARRHAPTIRASDDALSIHPVVSAGGPAALKDANE